MAKYDVTRACGHEETVQLYGPEKDREKTLRWMEQTPCSACYKQQQEKERSEKSRLDASWAEEAGLPALKGSTKQIAWAESIRASIMADFKGMIEAGREISRPPEMEAERKRKISAMWDWLSAQADSSWWIARRNHSAKTILFEAKQALFTEEEK